MNNQNTKDKSTHDEQLQLRCDEYLMQKHISSAITLINARCDNFNYVQHLNEVIAAKQSELLDSDASSQDIQTIQSKISLQKQKISQIKSLINQTQESNNQCIQQILNHRNEYVKLCNNIDEISTVQRLVQEYLDFMRQVMQVKKAINEHRQFILKIDQYIVETTESSSYIQLSEQINNFFQLSQQLPNISKSLNQLYNIQNNILPQLKTLNIEHLDLIEQEIQQLKLDIYQDILLNLVKIWGVNLKSLTTQIGQQIFAIHYEEEQNAQAAKLQQVILELQQFFQQFEPKEPLRQIEYQKITIFQENEVQAKPVSELLYFNRQFVKEILHFAQLIDCYDQIVQNINRSFQRSFSNSLVLSQLFYNKKYNILYNIIGMLQIQRQMPLQFLETITNETIKNVQKQLIQFSMDLYQEYYKNKQHLIKFINSQGQPSFLHNINYLFKTIMQILKIFIKNLTNNPEQKNVIQLIEKDVYSNIIECYIQLSSEYFTNTNFNVIFTKMDTYLDDVYNANSIYKDTCTLKLSTKIYKHLCFYIYNLIQIIIPFQPQIIDQKQQMYMIVFQTINKNTTDQRVIGYSAQVCMAINDIIYPSIIQQIYESRNRNKDMSLEQLCMVCQLSDQLATIGRLSLNYINNYFDVSVQQVLIIKEKLISKQQNLIGEVLLEKIKQEVFFIFGKIDFEKRYSPEQSTRKKELKHDFLKDLQGLVQRLNEQLRYMNSETKQLILQKLFPIITVQVFFQQLLANLHPQSLINENFRIISTDLENIQAAASKVDIFENAPSPQTQVRPTETEQYISPSQIKEVKQLHDQKSVQTQTKQIFKPKELFQYMLIQAQTNNYELPYLQAKLEKSFHVLSSLQLFTDLLAQYFSGKAITGNSKYTVIQDVFDIITLKTRVNTQLERDLFKQISNQLIIYDEETP